MDREIEEIKKALEEEKYLRGRNNQIRDTDAKGPSNQMPCRESAKMRMLGLAQVLRVRASRLEALALSLPENFHQVNGPADELLWELVGAAQARMNVY